MQINGRIILVQTEGRKVYALGYDLNTDGYTGNELSIMSSHIFDGKQIISMTYQATPHSLLWFVLSDGTCATCTYNPEHEVIGWSRQTISLKAISVCALQEELYLAVSSGYYLMRQVEGLYQDNGRDYESVLRTLRLSGDGQVYTSKKLIARVIVSALNSAEAWAAPGELEDEARNYNMI